jgi:RNA polymerase sigma-70 factor (ECF subfamily)
MVRAVCHRIVINAADADDATQMALISIVRALPSFDRRSKFSTWVYRIATNAALDEIRRTRRRAIPTQSDSVFDGNATDSTTAVDAQLDVSQALAQLSEDYRTAVVLRHVVDMEYEDIALVLEIPIGTVRSRIARGRAQLAEILGNSHGGSQRHNESNTTKGDTHE